MKIVLVLQRHSAHVNCRVLGLFSPSQSSTSSRALSTIHSKPLNDESRPSISAAAPNQPVQIQLMFKSTSAPTRAESIGPSTQATADAEERETAVVGKADDGRKAILDFGIPSLIPEWKKMFSRETLFTDVSAGITVGCIAVPLSLAIALASGVPAEVGLVTAAVSGVTGAMLGGTTLAVTGPAAAISLLVVSAVEQHGLEALPFITLACGGLQVASGVTRLGVVAKLVPVSVIAGFTTGVGTLILSGQLPKALGMTAPSGLNPLELLGFIGENLASVNPAAAALAVGTSAAMFGLPKVHPKMPSALLAVGGATVATHAFGLDVSLIGSIPSGLGAFQFAMPMLPPVESLPSLTGTVLLIYSMTSVESLLSCAALEKMKKTSYKHNPDQELVGQGLANVGSALFTGMPVTSVIARSSLNVRLNAATRLPGIVQAGFVFSSVVFLSDTISMIPMPALSGVLITTGMGMLNPTEFKHCYAVQKSDTIPFLTTVGGMISFGLAEGIGIGCASALAMNVAQNWTNDQVPGAKSTSRMYAQEAQTVHNMAGASTHDGVLYDDAGQEFSMDSSNSAVWKLHGPINFISMFEIDNMMRRLKEQMRESPKDAIVLDMHGVTSLEFTGIEELTARLVEAADGTPIQMVNCDEAMHDAMDLCDPSQQITRFSTLSADKVTADASF